MSLVDRLVQRLSRTSPARAPDADGRRRAAVAALVHDSPGEPRVLLMKRAERTGDPWSGHIALPGGGYQFEDRDLLATAIRETHEELGIDLSREQLLGNLAPLSPRAAEPALIEVTPFVFRTEAAPEATCGPEAFSAFWLPLELARSGALDGIYRYPVTSGDPLTFPSWSYDGHAIWGLTLRILNDLLAAATP